MAGASSSHGHREITVDTKGLCLLCLKPCVSLELTRLSCQHGLKQLLNHLRVDVKALFNCSPAFIELMGYSESMGVKATFCMGCSAVIQEFNRRYQEYEKILISLDNCVQSVHKLINDGDKSPERVREYVTRMRSQTTEELFNASFVYNLRSEAFKKSAGLKFQRRSPCVELLNINNVEPNKPNAFNSGVQKTNHHSTHNVSVSHNKINHNYAGLSTFSTKETLSCSNEFENSQYRCSFCNFEATNALALKHHRTDMHLVLVVNDSLETTVSDVECGQAIDAIFEEMIQSNRSCFKCELKFLRRTGNLKRHAVNAHFNDFLQLVENRVKEGHENDGRNEPMLDYLGLIRIPKTEDTTEAVTDQTEEDIRPSIDNAVPGCSKDFYATPKAEAGSCQKVPGLGKVAVSAASQRSLRLRSTPSRSISQGFPPARGVSTTIRQSKSPLVNGQKLKKEPKDLPKPKSQKKPSHAKSGVSQLVKEKHTPPNKSPVLYLANPKYRRSQTKALTNGTIKTPKTVTKRKFSETFVAGPSCDQNTPLYSSKKKILLKIPSPHPNIRKIYATLQHKNGFKCPFCSYQCPMRTTINRHLAVKHLPVLIHQTLDSSVTLESCSKGVKLLLAEKVTSKERKCFICGFELTELLMLKRHLVHNHFEELREEVESRLEQKMELSNEDE